MKQSWEHFGQRRRAPCTVAPHSLPSKRPALWGDEQQLKRQLNEMRNGVTTATTQQDPYLFLESLACAHEDFTLGLTTNTQCHLVSTCRASTSRCRALHFPLRVERCTDA